MNEMHLEFRSRLEGEGEEQLQVRVESLLWQRDGPKGGGEPGTSGTPAGERESASGQRREAKSKAERHQGRATAPAVPLSADSRSPESRAKRVPVPVPRGDLVLGHPPGREDGDGSGGAINAPNRSSGGDGGSDIQLSQN